MYICTYTCIHTDTYIHIDKRTVIDNRCPMIPNPRILHRDCSEWNFMLVLGIWHTLITMASRTIGSASTLWVEGYLTYKCTAYHWVPRASKKPLFHSNVAKSTKQFELTLQVLWCLIGVQVCPGHTELVALMTQGCLVGREPAERPGERLTKSRRES